ncbi:MAG TPA: threonine/serine exporter family protein [Roseiflexaceae bacterium]|nr:threonine/serine exporter family protein [Roseiflexaceae bacterium]
MSASTLLAELLSSPPVDGGRAPLSRDDLREVLVIAMRAGQLMLENGANTARVEETIDRIGTALGAQGLEVFVTPTGIIVTGVARGEHRTRIQRIVRTGIDLGRVAAVIDVSRRAEARLLDREGVRAELERIAVRPREYGPLPTTLAVALACASSSMLFGGGWRESLAALLASGAAFFPRAWLAEHFPSRLFVISLIAALGSALGMLLAQLLGATALAPTLLGSVLFLVPGLLMVSSTADLFRGDTISGMARAVSAALVLAAIGAGMWMVLIVSGMRADLETSGPPNLLAALLLAPLAASGFAVMFNVPRRALVYGAAVGALAYVIRLVTQNLGSPPEVAIFLGGAMIGLCGEVLARLLRLPTVLFTIPGFITLVPGTTAFRSLLDFVNARYNDGTEHLIRAALLTAALAAGLGTINAFARLRRPHEKPGVVARTSTTQR